MTEKITMTSAGGVELTYEIAGLGGRSFAFIIDYHIRFLVAFAWFMLAVFLTTGGFNFEGLGGSQGKGGNLFVIFGIIPPVVFYLLYHPLLEITMQGRTPGKRMAGVRIVAKDGTTASVGAIIVRNIFRIIDSLPSGYVLGFFVALLNKRSLRIGDMAAGTVLVYEEKVNRRGIDTLIETQVHTDHTTEQLDLLTELLERWRALERDVRIRLASQLLLQMGQAVPDETNKNRLDKALHQCLQSVMAGNKSS